MWYNTEVRQRLKIEYPIIQGPFGGGLSSTKLAAVVSNAGGLGSFGAHHLDAVQIRVLAHELRGLTNKPFALNLWISDHDAGPPLTQAEFEQHLEPLKPYFHELNVELPTLPERFGQRFEEQIEGILDAKPPCFSFVFGIPDPAILRECRQRGIVTIGTATTLDEALALDEAQVDVIVVSGFEAGGHRGAFLRPVAESLMGNLALLPQVVDRVMTPIVAAGGIADGRGIAAALVLGAQGVQIGTAFLACEESAASPAHRERLFSDDAKSTTLTRVFSGRLARGLRNRFSEEMQQWEHAVPGYPIQGWLTAGIKQAASANNRSDLMSLWAGQAAPLLRHTKAGVLFQALLDETATALQRLTNNLKSLN